ncbi:MAG: hypothetical protein HOV81_09435 [Kofleriaceae bacterium]|nr:hypothetical protein [Kofleriaceae bacterium]
MRLAAAILVVAACKPHVAPRETQPAKEGVSIAMYETGGRGYSVVDDRRRLDISGAQVLLANIDPGASLASLVIETGGDLRIGPCVRDRLPEPETEPPKLDPMRLSLRIPANRRLEDYVPQQPPPAEPPRVVPESSSARYAPVVRCAVKGTPGRRLVRIVYVSTTLRYRAAHDVSIVEPTRATLSSRFVIETPPWRVRAKVVLFDGVPGGDKPLREVVRGDIALDGSTAILGDPARTVDAELRRVYDGAILASDDKQDIAWGHDSVQSVWVWLELAKVRLAPGPIDVHIDLPDEGPRDAIVADTSRKQDDEPDAPLRLALWADESLRGMRQRIVDYSDGNVLTERVILGVGNMGDAPREVFVEEHLRPARKRRIERAWPKKPSAAGDVLRTKLVAKPGSVSRTGYTISYEL